MENVLHITNGDSAASLMRQGGITGTILPWHDVLHDGPVPISDDLSALSKIRARFISDRGWADYDQCLQSFMERDATLSDFSSYQRVCLWFEHDLYDQLQILQILDFLNRDSATCDHVEMICVDRYLGLMKPEELAGLSGQAESVSQKQYALASMAWQAFVQPAPDSWCALLERDLSPLQFLRGAVIRMLEEYPAVGTGVNRTEQQALGFLSAEPASAAELFEQNQRCEDRIYLGDSSYWIILRELMAGDRPLIRFVSGRAELNHSNKQEELRLTDVGRAILHGNLDRMTVYFPDRWIGGVHLVLQPRWRWNASNCRINLD